MNKEQLLADCVDEILSGDSTLESCLARHPGLNSGTRLLLAFLADIKANEGSFSAGFRTRARNYVLNAVRETSGESGSAEQKREPLA